MTPSRATGLGAFRNIAAVLRWPTRDARRWAESAFTGLCGSPDVVAVVLFGSSIRAVTSSFDLDCLFVYRGKRPVLPRAPMEVDMRAYRADEVDELVEAGHDLLVWSIRFGELVCERDEFWTQLKDRWFARLPFPPPEVADARAARAERMLNDLRVIGDEDAAVEQLLTAVTHRARAALLRANVFPASRPELPSQLRQIGLDPLADALVSAMNERNTLASQQIGRPDRIRDIA